MVAEDLQEDYNSNLEWADAAEILRVVVRGDAREYQVKWADSESYPDSWELEENLSPSLIEAWEAQQPAGASIFLLLCLVVTRSPARFVSLH